MLTIFGPESNDLHKGVGLMEVMKGDYYGMLIVWSLIMNVIMAVFITYFWIRYKAVLQILHPDEKGGGY